MTSKSNHNIKLAYEKGYRVTREGKVISHKGKELSIKIPNGARYPRMSIAVEGKRETFLSHRFAAYCFFGDKIFEEGIQVRHLNGDRSDFSVDNIALGTAKENDLDKSPEARKRSVDAVIKASTGRPPVNRIFNDEQVSEIKQKLSKGVRGNVLAREYGVSDAIISNIKTGVYYLT